MKFYHFPLKTQLISGKRWAVPLYELLRIYLAFFSSSSISEIKLVAWNLPRWRIPTAQKLAKATDKRNFFVFLEVVKHVQAHPVRLIDAWSRCLPYALCVTPVALPAIMH